MNKSATLKNVKEVMEYAKGKRMPVTEYDAKTNQLKIGALSVTEFNCHIDHLPQNGYSIARIRDEYFNRRFQLIKGWPISYPEATWLQPGTTLIYLNFDEEEIRFCQVSWEDLFYSRRFRLTFSGEEEMVLDAKSYGEEYVFLKTFE